MWWPTRAIFWALGFSLSFGTGEQARLWAQCVPNVSGLVGWWPGDGNASNILGTNNGTLSGGATANAAGVVGSAFNFDGTNNFVQVPDAVILKPTNFTIEGWVRFTGLDTPGTAAVGRQYLIFKQNAFSSNFEGFDLSKVRIAGSDRFVFRVSTSGGQSAAVYSTTLIATGVWYHLAAVRGANLLEIYLNGQLQSQTNVAFAQSYGTQPLFFGSSGQASFDRKFRGTLDEVTLYNRPLAANEIAAIYNAGAAGKCKEVIITSPPQNQNVQTGGNASFSVSATGFAPLRYRWLFNGATIVGATNAVLALINVQPSNAGNYAVAVSNTVNAVTSAPASLVISAPPVITNPPQSQTVVAGASVNFSVGATGTPPLSYQWRKGNVPLSGQTAATLGLLDVTTNDAGTYDVVVTNPAGSATSTPPATLTVNVPPFVSSPPSSQTVVAGTSVMFSVVAGGTQPLSYQWRKGGLPLTGQTSVSLGLLGVTTNDAGSYDVVVTNVAGAVTSTPPAILTVNVPPTITVVPQSRTVTANTSVALTVTAVGTTPLSYQWRKDGVFMPGQTSSTLQFLNVTTNDAGAYDVIVSNVAGAVTSAPPATLTVNVPPFFTTVPQSRTVTENSSVALTAGAGGTAPLSYQWRKEGLPINGQTGTTLSFASVTMADAGSYDIVVTNVAGSITSAPPAVLIVESSAGGYPGITNPPQSQTVVQGTDVHFSVGANGSAPLRFQWRKDGVNLPNQTAPTLLLASVVDSDAGNYDVIVTNSVGAVTSTPPATLTIIPQIVFKPAITNQPQSQRAGIGTTVSFNVNAAGTAPLSYQWRKNNFPIAGENAPTLTLPSVSTNDDGNYDVTVANVAGSVTSVVATLSVKLVVDPELEQAIVCSSSNQSGVLTLADLQSLARLSIRNRGVTNLFGLQFATNLTILDASENQISDLTPLQTLIQLSSLELDDNRGEIATLSPLAGLTNLTCLVLGQVYVNSYAPLSGLTNLTSLVVRKGNVTGLNFLQNLSRLSSLSLPYNRIRNITALSGLTNLTQLDLRWNASIANYSALQSGLSNLVSLHLEGNALLNAPSLQNLGRLRSLNLAENQLESLPSFSGLTNLNYLVLSRNEIADYSGLANLTNLNYLELSGNAISNVSFLSNLRALQYADLSYNQITNLTPLSGLTNLQGLVLAGNRPSSFAPLAGITALSNLWLQDCSITNAAFLSSLHRLRHLNLDDNFVTNLAPVLGLTNLTGLGLSRNPAANILSVSALTNLRSLRLEGNALAQANPLTNLFRLTYLSLHRNQLTNVAPLAALTNLEHQYLSRNRLRDISYAQFLPRAAVLDFGLNLLDPADGTPESGIIDGLHCQLSTVPQCACAFPLNAAPVRGVSVNFLKQHSVPSISAPAKWFIAKNGTSSTDFTVWYEMDPVDALPVVAGSSNPGLIDNSGLNLGSSDYSRVLFISPNPGQTGDASITLTVFNEGGLSASTNIQISVVEPVDVEDMMEAGGPLDPELESAFRQASGNYDRVLTSVDLLNITEMTAAHASFSGFQGWQWLTNLTSLYVSGATGDLGFLTHLTQLRSLHASGVAATELAELSILTNLTHIDVSGLSISNLSFLTPLTSLRSLIVNRTRIGDLTPLSGLTNLTNVRVERNMVTNIVGLYTLPQLSFVDVRYNLLAISPGSLALAVIDGLEARGVTVDYLPQRGSPVIEIADTWNVSADRTSILSFRILENDEAAFGLTGVGSHSSNLVLLPDSNQDIALDTTSTVIEWALTVSPVAGQSGSTVMTITATNDVGLSSSTNLLITVSQPQPINGDFFGMTDLTWQTDGDISWFGQSTISTAGFPAAQTGAIGHGEESILESTLIGPGTLRFWWKVSSEENFDWLIFESLQVTNQISGEVDWEEQVIAIEPRTQTVRWRYIKDLNAVNGMDAGWVARVSFVPATWLDFTGAPTNAQAHLALYGVPGQEYAMEISTDATNWQLLRTVLSTNRITPFVDVAATNAVRFYRARALLDSPILGLSNQTAVGFDLTWPGVGVLQASPTPSGPWEEIGGVSPYYVSAQTAPMLFFRVKVVGD
ncbi:MAG TPA: immunoglobulin domain-containing protein [Verrucomicrobiae bacterium]|nr:immunoglobulin domain-containing protein [Verrucomicrobiae bacterium]